MADKKQWPWFCPLINNNCVGAACWCYDENIHECKNPMLNEDKKDPVKFKNSIQAKYKK